MTPRLSEAKVQRVILCAQARTKRDFLFIYLTRVIETNQRKRARGLAPLTPSDPRAQNTSGARVPNGVSLKQRLLVDSDPKGCVGDADTVYFLG